MNKYLKKLNRIEFVITYACTGRCRHCSEGEHLSRGEHMDGDAAVAAVHELCARYQIESLMTFGGEPLLYPDVVCRIHNSARKEGIPQRDLITNGFFTKDQGRIREVAAMLAESGVKKVALSVDAFHQETIPLEPVRFFAECVKATDMEIKIHPAWLVSIDAENPYNRKTRELLKIFTEMGIEVSEGNVIFLSGNARKYLSEYFDPDKDYVNPYAEDPADVHTISFEPNGDVLNGNLFRDGLEKGLTEYCPESSL